MPVLALTLNGRGLNWGTLARAATIDVTANAPAVAHAASASPLAARPVDVRVAATTGVHAAGRDFSTTGVEARWPSTRPPSR
ncbi:MAG: hypothetical protein U1F10_04205 [Burkholderiales bacterium]